MDRHTHTRSHTHTHSYTHMHTHAHTHTRSHTHTLTHTHKRDRKRQTEQDILSDKGQAMCPQWGRNRLAGWVRDAMWKHPRGHVWNVVVRPGSF